MTDAGRRNVADILAFYEAEGRLPIHGRSARESALAGWLVRRRGQAADGTLSPAYAAAIDTIPGWRDQPSKQEADAARWKQRLTELSAYLAAGNEMPRHNKTDDREERTLGVWLHTQRIDCRAGKLSESETKEKHLNEVIPGWRQGRQRRGRNNKRDERWPPLFRSAGPRVSGPRPTACATWNRGLRLSLRTGWRSPASPKR